MSVTKHVSQIAMPAPQKHDRVYLPRQLRTELGIGEFGIGFCGGVIVNNAKVVVDYMCFSVLTN